ncbi:MAG: radical SAM protein [Pseudomonadota bacterium]|nr:radical SAM protein [Pseudomonadota bacterium]
MLELATPKIKKDLSLKINEIFYSIQGESNSSGYPTLFIRLTGCPLRCNYCDTSYAFSEGKMMSISDILAAGQIYKPSFITVTGGEPLAQRNCLELLKLLCDKYENVSLETSGAISTRDVDCRVRKIIDIKTPDSGEEKKNYLKNLNYLQDKDELKFVICSKSDFLWSVDFLKKFNIDLSQVTFSPSHEQINIKELAELMLEFNVKVKLQSQLHKIIWGNVPGK